MTGHPTIRDGRHREDERGPRDGSRPHHGPHARAAGTASATKTSSTNSRGGKSIERLKPFIEGISGATLEEAITLLELSDARFTTVLALAVRRRRWSLVDLLRRRLDIAERREIALDYACALAGRPGAAAVVAAAYAAEALDLFHRIEDGEPTETLLNRCRYLASMSLGWSAVAAGKSARAVIQTLGKSPDLHAQRHGASIEAGLWKWSYRAGFADGKATTGGVQ